VSVGLLLDSSCLGVNYEYVCDNERDISVFV